MLNLDININEKEPIVIGCSAGPDSMALLNYIINNLNNLVIVAHINHNVRIESDEEENYLHDFCKNNNIIFESYKIKEYNNKNFENEARIKRYNFYEKTLKKYNSKYLLLAHHGDDLIETILMKIERGSNIEGYAGIKEISKLNNYTIIRPLLKYTKQDLINYNKKHNIKYYIDKSNNDTQYTRNRYRLNILPELKKENINIHKQFLKYSKTLQEYINYIDYEIDNYINALYTNNKLNLENFSLLHPFIQKNILYKLLNKIYNNKPNIVKEKNINDILNIINNNKPNIYINLPNNKHAIKEYNYLYIKDNIKNNNCFKEIFKNKYETNFYIIEKINETPDDSNKICRINSKNIKLPLYIRNKKDGDKIEVLGLKGHKKVSDIFIDKKISKEKRNSYPLLVDSNDNIIWIPNLKKSKFNSKKGEFCDIILKYCEKEENNE